MLVPLTNSLYVKGEITAGDTVLVDVGTGFLVEKVFVTPSFCKRSFLSNQNPQKLGSAETFYAEKVKELGENLKELEAIVSRKQGNARSVEEGKCHYRYSYIADPDG